MYTITAQQFHNKRDKRVEQQKEGSSQVQYSGSDKQTKTRRKKNTSNNVSNYAIRKVILLLLLLLQPPLPLLHPTVCVGYRFYEVINVIHGSFFLCCFTAVETVIIDKKRNFVKKKINFLMYTQTHSKYAQKGRQKQRRKYIQRIRKVI